MLRRLHTWLGKYLIDKSYHHDFQDPSLDDYIIHDDNKVSWRPDVDPSYNIRVYSANGGRIIECRTTTLTTVAGRSGYDHDTRLYVISDGADLTEELGKILMIDSLSN